MAGRSIVAMIYWGELLKFSRSAKNFPNQHLAPPFVLIRNPTDGLSRSQLLRISATPQLLKSSWLRKTRNFRPVEEIFMYPYYFSKSTNNYGITWQNLTKRNIDVLKMQALTQNPDKTDNPKNNCNEKSKIIPLKKES